MALCAGEPVRPMIIEPTLRSLFTSCRKDARLARNQKPMKRRDRVDPQRYERTLLELRWERKSENTRVERLSAILAKKSSAKAPTPSDRAA
jgi:hypothetical protein